MTTLDITPFIAIKHGKRPKYLNSATRKDWAASFLTSRMYTWGVRATCLTLLFCFICVLPEEPIYKTTQRARAVSKRKRRNRPESLAELIRTCRPVDGGNQYMSSYMKSFQITPEFRTLKVVLSIRQTRAVTESSARRRSQNMTVASATVAKLQLLAARSRGGLNYLSCCYES